jgi:hypothetical protein
VRNILRHFSCRKAATTMSTISNLAYSAGILEQSMGTRNRVGIGLSYRTARLHRLAESTVFLGS